MQVFELGENFDTLPDLVIRDVFLPPNQSGSWAFQIDVADLNGDGNDDIVIAQNPQAQSGLNGRVHIYIGGPEFDTIPSLTIVRRGANAPFYNYFGYVVTCPGDLNGDGYEDLFVAGAGEDDTSWVYFGGPSLDTIPDVIIPLYIKHAAPAGDINRDGYADLLASYDVSFSGDGRVYVFYGGPEFDSNWDIRIANWDDNIYQTGFGMAIAGLGDFDGDGVDDFAFSAMDALSKGLVYIYSGTGTPVDVPNDPSNLPSDFTLYPNYPNPFNPSTNIAFDLPRRARVTLSIVNILGQEVAKLVDQEMSVGSHSVAWDGRDASGKPAASGVYLYRLETEDGALSRKMLLLK